jgi:hypothetical protein
MPEHHDPSLEPSPAIAGGSTPASQETGVIVLPPALTALHSDRRALDHRLTKE